MTEAPKPDHVVDLERWRNDGTFTRLDSAHKTRTPVQIRRSSGEFVTGIIAGFGHGGLTHVVAWGDDLDGVHWNVGRDQVTFPPGVQGKRVDTKDLLGWNPSLKGVKPLASGPDSAT